MPSSEQAEGGGLVGELLQQVGEARLAGEIAGEIAAESAAESAGEVQVGCAARRGDARARAREQHDDRPEGLRPRVGEGGAAGDVEEQAAAAVGAVGVESTLGARAAVVAVGSIGAVRVGRLRPAVVALARPSAVGRRVVSGGARVLAEALYGKQRARVKRV